jgi:DNA-directed RNA polymerase specialized sigma24 family protein
MLMRTKAPDFHAVDQQHEAIHARLLNWAEYVRDRRPGWPTHPMWRQGRSNSRQWHPPEYRPTLDLLDGHELEKAVAALPARHRDAIRWSYVYRTTPAVAVRLLACTYDGLHGLVKDGRTMLCNRLKKVVAAPPKAIA